MHSHSPLFSSFWAGRAPSTVVDGLILRHETGVIRPIWALKHSIKAEAMYFPKVSFKLTCLTEALITIDVDHETSEIKYCEMDLGWRDSREHATRYMTYGPGRRSLGRGLALLSLDKGIIPPAQEWRWEERHFPKCSP